MKPAALLFSFMLSTLHAQVFTLVDSIQYTQAQIWGVVSDQGDSLVTTTTFTPGTRPHIYLRKGDYATISNQTTPIQLTFDSDFAGISNMTDHKSIILNNELFVSFSTLGDSNLFIFKTDLNGNRIGSIVSVVANQTDPTNDMILVTDSTYLYVLHFDPPNQHHVYKFDSNLNPVGSSFSTTTLGHNNIGNALWHNNEFFMMTGNVFGVNANLVLTKWNSSWSPTIGSPQTILSSSGGDGNWFATGEIWDEVNQRWYVGISHLNAGESINMEHIDLIAFDASFNLLERIHITGQGYYRPHFVLKNGFLYVSYDKPGNGVYLHQYQVANTVGIEEIGHDGLIVFPNPAADIIHVHSSSEQIWLTDVTGKIIQQIDINNQHQLIDISELNSGIYFVKDGKGGAFKLIRN